MTMKVQGLESTLKVLNQIQPDVKKQFFKDARNILKPAVDEAKNLYRDNYLSGMGRRWAPGGRTIFPYDKSAAVKNVKIETSLSRKKDAVLTIVQKDVAATVLDTAGKITSNALGRALNTIVAHPRVMWRAYESNAGQIEREMSASVDDVMKRISALEKMVFL